MQQELPEKGIRLIQPDILQLKHKAEIPSVKKTSTENKAKRTKLTDKDYSPYINLLNIKSMWRTTLGEKVKIAIIDDGINLAHEDLQHISKAFSYDIETHELSTFPRFSLDRHGTKVAGIIFADHNNIGINGIAPRAELISLRQTSTWTSKTLLSFQLAKLAGASIINCSWHSQTLMQPLTEIIEDLAINGRKGKGIAVVISAGNKGIEIQPNSIEGAIDSAIVVGASDLESGRLPFSNYGPSIDVYTYGKGVKTTLKSGGYGVFSGTSLAAAIVTGVSALLLSETPELTVKQLSKKLQVITQTNKNN